MDSEREHIMRVLAGCMERSQWQAAKSLTWAIENYLDVQGHLTERILVNQARVNLARQLKNRREESAWIGNLGNAYRDSGEVEKAIEYMKQSLILFEEIKSPTAVRVRQWLKGLTSKNNLF